MEDTLVSSRISSAKKEAGVNALAAIGATTSDLINSAFDYVIEVRQLPAIAPEIKERGAYVQELADFIEGSTLEVDWESDERSYKDILRERKVADYESLA